LSSEVVDLVLSLDALNASLAACDGLEGFHLLESLSLSILGLEIGSDGLVQRIKKSLWNGSSGWWSEESVEVLLVLPEQVLDERNVVMSWQRLFFEVSRVLIDLLV